MSELGPENLDTLIPAARAEERGAQATAFRNSSLQGVYLMTPARALGLDGGAMSGLDPKGVNEAVFAGARWTANVLVNLAHSDASCVFMRSPRLDFSEACRID